MGTRMLTLEQTHLTVIDSGRGSNSTVAVAAGSGVQFSSEVVVGRRSDDAKLTDVFRGIEEGKQHFLTNIWSLPTLSTQHQLLATAFPPLYPDDESPQQLTIAEYNGLQSALKQTLPI
eukprot:scaffold3786_cov204-Alexandrium_tamarense.AAC.22